MSVDDNESFHVMFIVNVHGSCFIIVITYDVRQNLVCVYKGIQRPNTWQQQSHPNHLC